MKLVSMCVNFGSFTFEGEEFLQHNGLAMGSPLSAVAACLFMEVQEKDHYSHMVGRRPIWLRSLSTNPHPLPSWWDCGVGLLCIPSASCRINIPLKKL
ncbi:uncharacterized protein LOC143022641 isoform X2 [Oratosquilla oratoria]|uniref:uncharacterized protein LOC143022641 isoform X2 n=1 Tax=Oratosquilla oratoria TaxID=337810 RepID=UPI003F76825F